ncbi:MAG: hypothetical protein M1820_007349 [Bogoriella megaspora]|nr:MAG: hypothetical protein M1820_007349 [Bogoriella megaspora]
MPSAWPGDTGNDSPRWLNGFDGGTITIDDDDDNHIKFVGGLNAAPPYLKASMTRSALMEDIRIEWITGCQSLDVAGLGCVNKCFRGAPIGRMFARWIAGRGVCAAAVQCADAPLYITSTTPSAPRTPRTPSSPGQE